MFLKCIFLRSWRLESYYRAKNAAKARIVEFLPLGIRLRKAEGGNRKKGKLNKADYYVYAPRDPLAEGRRRKKAVENKTECVFSDSSFVVEVRSAEKDKVICCFSDFLSFEVQKAKGGKVIKSSFTHLSF